MSAISRVFQILLILGAASGLGRAQPAPWTKAVDEVFSRYDVSDAPGVSVAVVLDGKIAYSSGFGLANLEYGVKNDAGTVFHVASISKQFTCFAIHLLAEEGKLSIDDDVRKHLSWVPDFGETITLRHLMHHTSGLRDQWQLLVMAGYRLDDVITMEHLRKMIARQRELNFLPGAESLYSNSGYTLLADVVAAVSGMSFKEFTQKRIFDPLEMSHTHFHDDHRHVVANRAYSYSPAKDGFRKSVLSYANVGATSLFTTTEDLTRWLINLDSGRVGGVRVRDRMRERGALSNGEKISYGFGLVHGEHDSMAMISHGGSDAGFRSFIARIPDKRLGVVVLGNRSDLHTSGLARRVIDAVLAGGDTEEIKTDSAETKKGFVPQKRVSLSREALDRCVGSFMLGNGMLVRIFRDGDKLFRRAGGFSVAELIPHSERAFSVARSGNRFFIDGLSEANPPSGITIVLRTGGTRRGERIDEDALASQRAYTGLYYSPELEASYEILQVGDGLVARHPRWDDIELTPISKTRCRGGVWFFGNVEFEIDAKGKASGFRLSGGRVRNLRFVRKTEIRRF